MPYPCQVITFLIGPSASFLNVSEAFSSGDVFGDSVGQNRGSSSVNGDGEEHEIQQVWKIIDFESGPILEMRKDLVGRC